MLLGVELGPQFATGIPLMIPHMLEGAERENDVPMMIALVSFFRGEMRRRYIGQVVRCEGLRRSGRGFDAARQPTRHAED